MATRNIVPRGDGEGNIGTSLKNWLKGWFKEIFVGPTGLTCQGQVKIGDGTTTGDKEIMANDGRTPARKIRYNETTEKWEFTDDGTIWTDLSGLPTDRAFDAVNEAEQSTTLLTWVDCLSLVFTPTVTSDYDLHWYLQATNSNAGKKATFRVTQNGTEISSWLMLNSDIYSNGNWNTDSGFRKVTLTGGVQYTFKIQVLNVANTEYFRNLRLSARRVI